MARRDGLNEKALLAASLRRKMMTVSDIACYLPNSERQVRRYLDCAKELYRLLARTQKAEKYLCQTLTVSYEMERKTDKNPWQVNGNYLFNPGPDPCK